MESPHLRRHAVLLERITKNADKCNEAMQEVVKCLSEITNANESAVQTAQLFAAYRSFVSKNMEIKGMNQPVKLEGSIHPAPASATTSHP